MGTDAADQHQGPVASPCIRLAGPQGLRVMATLMRAAREHTAPADGRA